MAMPMSSLRPRRRVTVGTVVVAGVVACSLVAVPLTQSGAFIVGRAAESMTQSATGLVEHRLPVSPRSRIVGTFGVLVGMPSLWAGSMQSSVAEPASVPDALSVTGRVGTRDDINGRWSMAFGKKLNGRAVYKKDGGSDSGQPYYLMVNNCNQFQMDTQVKGECDGFAVKGDDGWKIDGKVDPEVKLKPYEIPKDDAYEEEGLFR
mmetsp:Transcript_69437/g.175034  ORF Transcript_69437/g.175034 Transcript_69437/m.175034 type:complete len:205 (-) Transcript_69437:194-808(-)|eukprot:CAMPEP_0115577368 /NCGR_PEP_ID=MMETSP0272-20121206/3037_1 /TAXON_ID=71861 /ORGANISM="Scrippsiella trochoidea, Strain CCMP3099" /LENGTH=204 /DNA_ID=CAMNT_0003012179 /DNA_START=37 /DNA_END=651 /DNA_ORIENTATION=+